MSQHFFKGRARRIEDIDIAILAHRIAIGEDEMRAVMEIEAGKTGFDSQGRVKMLFEPHVFYKHLSGAKLENAVSQGLAYPKWGTQSYPPDSYPRFLQAIAVDEVAATMSASWGRAQILGENYRTCGYETPQQMVAAFAENEKEHIEAMIAFILANNLDDEIRDHRWAAFARTYNGPGYAKWGYDKKLASEYKRQIGVQDHPWKPASSDVVPMNGDQLKSVQKRLRELGYNEVGMIDGSWGSKTRAAVLAFRADRELPIYAGIDDEFFSELMRSEHRPVTEERATAQIEDLRKEGSRTIEATDKTNITTILIAVGSALAGLREMVDNIVGDVTGWGSSLLAVLEPLTAIFGSAGPWILVALAAVIFWQQWKIKKARVEDHRNGVHAGPERAL